MTDVVPPDIRSKMMSNIRRKNTKPEMIVRRAIYAAGYRYRLHDGKYPGRPDLAISRRHVVIFVHGCFWHAHRNCRYFKMPASNMLFWTEKFEKNRLHDRRVTRDLLTMGWRVITIWECALRTPTRAQVATGRLLSAIAGTQRHAVIR